MTPPSQDPSAVTGFRVLRLWWPLALSWMLMGVEGPLLAAAVARLPDPEPQLAAWSAVVFPVSLLVEAPIIMLLAASTALSRDRVSHAKLRRFAHAAGAALTAVHLLVAFTPLFDLFAERLLQAPAESIEPARLGLRIMTPWTWTIAYRRFQQGVLIRAGRSRAVGAGTLVRLAANACVLGLGLWWGAWPGIAVGASAVAVGVTAEAVFVGWLVQPCVRELPERDTSAESLTRARFLRFYLPLAATPMIGLLMGPLGAAAMGRMPMKLESLAVWTPAYGLIFLFRSSGYAFNEVVVALAGQQGAVRALRRFAWTLAACTSGCVALLAATPLGRIWFGEISALAKPLAALAATALAFGVLMPGYAALQNWFQGLLVHSGRTRAITEAMALNLLLIAAGLWIGVKVQPPVGIHWTLATFTLAGLCNTGWLAWRARAPLAALAATDRVTATPSAPGDRP